MKDLVSTRPVGLTTSVCLSILGFLILLGDLHHRLLPFFLGNQSHIRQVLSYSEVRLFFDDMAVV